MPADKLGKYMTSADFLQRANAAVKKSVSNLEAKGIDPAYSARRSKRGLEGKDIIPCPPGSRPTGSDKV